MITPEVHIWILSSGQTNLHTCCVVLALILWCVLRTANSHFWYQVLLVNWYKPRTCHKQSTSWNVRNKYNYTSQNLDTYFEEDQYTFSLHQFPRPQCSKIISFRIWGSSYPWFEYQHRIHRLKPRVHIYNRSLTVLALWYWFIIRIVTYVTLDMSITLYITAVYTYKVSATDILQDYNIWI
jgi:hypothetical protein